MDRHYMERMQEKLDQLKAASRPEPIRSDGAGDVGYVPMVAFHYVQNIGKEKVVFLEFFNSSHFADVSLSQWIALTPKEVVKSCLNLSD